MSGIIRWEEPPTSSTMRAEAKAQRWQPVAEALKQRPGQWAVVEEGHPASVGNVVTYVKSGRGPFAPAGSFEAKSRMLPEDSGPRKTLIYARYVGPERAS